MSEEAAPEFGFEPGRLGGHDLAGIGDPKQLVHAGGVQTETDGPVTVIGESFQLGGSSAATDETDPGVEARVADSQEWLENPLLQERDVRVGK